MDADLTGQGLAYWQGGASSPTKSLFSGQYRILHIQNKFDNGKFEQVLKLARYANGDYGKLLAGTVGLNDRANPKILATTGEVVATSSSTTHIDSDTNSERIIT
jgi:hypothetical protein